MNIRHVLITGGTGKVGQRLVEGFSHAGWQVTLTSRSQERAEDFARELQMSTGASIQGIGVELDRPGGPSRLVQLLRQKALLPDCLINNTRDRENLGLDEQGKPVADGWQKEFHLNVVVAYELVMELAAVPGGRLRSVINVASMYGVVAPNIRLYENPDKESPIHYGVCKAALIHLTKELSVRLASKGIRVNAISYGGIEGRTSKEFVGKYSELCPQGRMLSDTDIVGPALFLADESAAGVTGHNLVADGGWSVW